MSEQDWLACADPDSMAVFLHYKYIDTNASRKLGLLACACLRRIWVLLADERSRRAIEVLEKELETPTEMRDVSESFHVSEFGQAHRAALEGWTGAADVAADDNYSSPLLRAMPDAGLAAYQAVEGDLQCLKNASSAAANYAASRDTLEWLSAKEVEQKAQVAIIRRIFPDSFHN